MLGRLARHFRGLNERYHGAEGDAFALEELAPVALRFAPPGGRVLEVGCGYGRNLVALATLDAGMVAGSDPLLDELRRARERVDDAARAGITRAPVALVRQDDLALP